MSLKVSAVYIYVDLLSHLLLIGGEKVKFLLIDVVHTLKAGTFLDRPAERAYMYLKFLLKLIKKVKGIITLTVHLVYKDNDRGLAHTTHLHEAAGLHLNALSAVNHYDYAVNSCQGTERILGKILVTRGIQNIYLVTFIIKLHDRCSHRDSTLFLNIHPVRCSGLAYLV